MTLYLCKRGEELTSQSLFKIPKLLTRRDLSLKAQKSHIRVQVHPNRLGQL